MKTHSTLAFEKLSPEPGQPPSPSPKHHQQIPLSARKRRDTMNTKNGGGADEACAPPSSHDDEYLKGPISLQMALMYAFFMIIVTSAEMLNWAPYIRFANFIPYIFICLILLELPRFISAHPVIQVTMQFYSTLIPFVYACIFSREAHIFVSLLYFCGTMGIFLQSGLPFLERHVMGYTLTFSGCYLACVAFMIWFYTDTSGLESYKGKVLTQPISWAQEVTLIVAIVLLGAVFLMVVKFIKKYANSLLLRSQQILLLEKEKEELKHEVAKFKGKDDRANVDLEAPVQKVISSLQSMVDSNSMANDAKEQLRLIIKIIASNKLYAPNLEFSEKSVDGETSSWLHGMLTSGDVKSSNKFSDGLPGQRLGSAAVTIPQNYQLDTAQKEKVQSLLTKINEWDFYVGDVARLTNGRPLYFVVLTLFNQHDLIRKFKIDEKRLENFLTIMETSYLKVPFHNSTHAADIVQTLNYFITRAGLGQYLTELDVFAALVAAIIHDVGHPGLNNAYHINTQAELAVRYNDKSVLENFHCSMAFQLMYNDECNIMSGLTESQRKEMRESVVAMVLATDMAQHFDLLGRFKSKLSGNGFDPKDRKDRLLLLQIAIKCADISNPTKPTDISNRWTDLVMAEFYDQGDEEKKKGIPISAFMDRQKPAVAKCQLGFIDFIVGPLFEVWVNFLPDASLALVHLEQNRAHWKKSSLIPEQIVQDPPPAAPAPAPSAAAANATNKPGQVNQ